MEHKDLAAEFEAEVQLQKKKENFLKARHILSDKQNSANNLQEKADVESLECHTIEMAFQSFVLDGNIDKFMASIKNTSYFGKPR